MASYLTISPELKAAIEADFQAGKTKKQITTQHGVGRAHLKRFFPERFRTYKKEEVVEIPSTPPIDTPKRGRGRPKKVVTE